MPTTTPANISAGQWMPAMTREMPIMAAPAKNNTAHRRWKKKTAIVKAKKKAAWPEGNEPVGS